MTSHYPLWKGQISPNVFAIYGNINAIRSNYVAAMSCWDAAIRRGFVCC